MIAYSLQRLVSSFVKKLLIYGVMRLSRFRHSAPDYMGARVVLYHETPAETAEQFRQHLEYFAKTYEIVSLDRLVEAIRTGETLNNWLAITFDDGFKDNLEIAAPLLEEYGLTACFFVTTGFVSLDPSDREGYRRFMCKRFRRSDSPQGMNWDDLRSLLDRGFSVGSHSREHLNLVKTPFENAVEDIAGSRRDIEKRLGIAAVHFAWPFGQAFHFDDSLRQALCNAGFVTGCSAKRGVNHHRTPTYNLNRDHLDPTWSTETLRFFLEGGYDWVRRATESFGDVGR